MGRGEMVKVRIFRIEAAEHQRFEAPPVQEEQGDEAFRAPFLIPADKEATAGAPLTGFHRARRHEPAAERAFAYREGVLDIDKVT